jgi:hypothetical protein
MVARSDSDITPAKAPSLEIYFFSFAAMASLRLGSGHALREKLRVLIAAPLR